MMNLTALPAGILVTHPRADHIGGAPEASPATVFATLREWKNTFR